MKNLLIILILATFAFAACHTKKEQAKSGSNDPTNIIYGDIDSSVISKGPAAVASICIDSAKIDTSAVCTMDYTPVCGCDKKTYSNACMATKAGVTKWTVGECK